MDRTLSFSKKAIDNRAHGLPRRFNGKEFACQYRKGGFDPWSGRSPGEGNGRPLQQEDPMDRGAW